MSKKKKSASKEIVVPVELSDDKKTIKVKFMEKLGKIVKPKKSKKSTVSASGMST